jgi:hypothetical protein
MQKTITDITVVYAGEKIKVSHSLYKPFNHLPALIRFTFHFSNRKIAIQRAYNLDNDQIYWEEVGKGITSFAQELGEAYSNFDSATSVLNNISSDIEASRPNIPDYSQWRNGLVRTLRPLMALKLKGL